MANSNTNITLLLQALTEANKYPRNTCGLEVQEHAILALEDQLNRRAPKLFSSHRKVHFLEVYRDNEKPAHTVICDETQLERHLRQPYTKQNRPDPRQRYMFLHAPDNKSPLRIDQHMLFQILTYHQIAPAFLDFINPFGRRLHDDFSLSGFRSETCQYRPRPGLSVPQLERSGKHIEILYSLKSVERSKDLTQPWSIRQCSVHHKFDLVSQQSAWIIVKANKLMRDAVRRLLEKDAETTDAATRHDTPAPLARTLAVHRAICTWAGDNWHRYITELENELQEGSRSTLYNCQEPAEFAPSSPMAPPPDQLAPLPRRASTRTFKSIGKALKRAGSSVTCGDDQTTVDTHDLQNFTSDTKQPDVTVVLDDYKFSDQQEIQRFEDRLNGVRLILKANAGVVQDLGREYANLQDVADECRMDLEEFSRHLKSVNKDLEMQQSRIDTLLKIAADRKMMVQGILQYRNMRAMQHFSTRAQDTAEEMKIMTQKMHQIADKAMVDTVSMKIITAVTLFFLPATFISTLMSTPMVHFDAPTSGFSRQNIGVGALKLYCIVTVPLTVLTIFAVLVWLAWFLRGHKQQSPLDHPFKMV